MAHCLAADFGTCGITVNVVQPGSTDTDMNPAHGALAGFIHNVIAIECHGTAGVVASMVLYFAGPQARGITGAMHIVDSAFGA